jgi:hypothetical protein
MTMSGTTDVDALVAVAKILIDEFCEKQATKRLLDDGDGLRVRAAASGEVKVKPNPDSVKNTRIVIQGGSVVIEQRTGYDWREVWRSTPPVTAAPAPQPTQLAQPAQPERPPHEPWPGQVFITPDGRYGVHPNPE